MGNTRSKHPSEPGRDSTRDSGRDDEAQFGWVCTIDTDDHSRWWRRGSSNVTANYTRLDVQKTTNHWSAYVRNVNRFGVKTNSRRLTRYRAEMDGAEERIRKVARKFRNNHPATQPFDGVPSLPEPGKWSLDDDADAITATTNQWVWNTGMGSTMRVEQTSRRSYYAGWTDFYDVSVELDGEVVELVSDETTLRALRTAVRSMKANPNLGTDVSIPEELRSTDGLGPVRCRRLVLLGVDTRLQLATLLNGDGDTELVDICDKIAPSMTENDLGGTIG